MGIHSQLLLALGCFVPTFLGIFLVQPVLPLDDSLGYDAQESGWNRLGIEDIDPTGYHSVYTEDDEDDKLSEEDDHEEGTKRGRTGPSKTVSIQVAPATPTSSLQHAFSSGSQTNYETYGSRRGKNATVAFSPSILSEEGLEEAPLGSDQSVESLKSLKSDKVDISGWALVREGDFWLLTS